MRHKTSENCIELFDLFWKSVCKEDEVASASSNDTETLKKIDRKRLYEKRTWICPTKRHPKVKIISQLKHQWTCDGCRKNLKGESNMSRHCKYGKRQSENASETE